MSYLEDIALNSGQEDILSNVIGLGNYLREQEEYEQNLGGFFQGAWPFFENAEFLPNWAIDAMAEHLEAVTYGQIKRLLINISPRTGKTNLTSICWPAWTWAQRNKTFLSGPQVKFMCGSYNDKLTLSNSNKVRRLIGSPFYQKYWADRFRLAEDQNSKCLVKGTQVLMSDGSLKPIEGVKETDIVCSYDIDSHKIVEDKVSNVWFSGLKRCKKVTLSDGSVFIASNEHRIRGWDGWSYVGDMKPGDPIGVARYTAPSRNKFDVDDAFLLALWLSEGDKAACGYTFTNSDPLIVERAKSIAEKRGWEFKNTGIYRYALVAGKNVYINTPMQLLKDNLGCHETYRGRTKLDKQKTNSIRIPNSIMSGCDESVIEFISTYIACDGYVLYKPNYGIAITTISERMARDFSLLLKRFGVLSRINRNLAAYTKNGVKVHCQDVWTVKILAGTEVMKLDFLNLYSKDEKFRNVLKWFGRDNIKTSGKWATVPPHDICDNRWSTEKVSKERALKNERIDLVKKIEGDLIWHKIVSIEEAGEVETWHLQTEKTHLFFIDGGILSHNSRFDNNMGGSLIATSVRGSLLGVGGDVVVVDDPQNTAEAESEAERLTAEQWWKEVKSTRLNSPKNTPIVVNMQRLHTKDISGLILDAMGRGEEEWVHLMIPMRYDWRRKCVTVILPRDQFDEFGDEVPEEEQVAWTDPRETPGELMWPERFDEKAVQRMEAGLGPIMAAGRLQQTPTPAGGAILKRDWWRPWDQEEAMKYGLEWGDAKGQLKEFPEFEMKIASLDTAFGEKEENDFSALTVWGVWVDQNKNPRAMLIYGWDKKLPLHGEEPERISGEGGLQYKQRIKSGWGLVEWVAATCKEYKVERILIENKTRGHDVAKEIQRLYAREKWGIELINPTKDKITRAHSIVPVFSAGTVYAPVNLTWCDDIITQCELFPKDDHDDYVDTVTQAIKWLRDTGILVRNEEAEYMLEDEATYDPRSRTNVASLYGV